MINSEPSLGFLTSSSVPRLDIRALYETNGEAEAKVLSVELLLIIKYPIGGNFLVFKLMLILSPRVSFATEPGYHD